MASYKSDFIRTLDERGFIHQCSDLDALDTLASKEIVTAYIGFDCTAPSLHAGSLMVIMLLRWLQKTGHRPIALMGGGTTKVGDPSGKDESRQLLSEEQIAANMAGIKGVFSRYLTFGDGPRDAMMVNNADWLDKLQYINFLRDYGPHFTINRMMTFESVKLRLDREQPLTFLEFNYMILQAYDFLELARRHGCHMQMGASDQWGNIINGLELGRRVDGKSLYALTTHLLTTSSGAKMGKSVAGAVWLNADRTSPYEFWQYWRNTEDGDVGRFLKLFTELPLDECNRLGSLRDAEINTAKTILANEVTKLAHGEAAAREAEATARATFAGGGAGEALPTFEITQTDLDKGLPVFEALRIAGLAKSNGEARRLIKGGGASVNNEVVSDELAQISAKDLRDGAIKLSAGKKRHALVKPTA
ncbi:MAG: tyrosine--tRNA ligase [Rhodospirillales bacterium]|jgi:tyrosyl-tRNA synthetase|nr:tyrosine--tRNA ligase [Rhodospirillales bacterium]